MQSHEHIINIESHVTNHTCVEITINFYSAIKLITLTVKIPIAP